MVRVIRCDVVVWMTNYSPSNHYNLFMKTVRNMNNMFYGATRFNADVSAWDVAKGMRAPCNKSQLKSCDVKSMTNYLLIISLPFHFIKQ